LALEVRWLALMLIGMAVLGSVQSFPLHGNNGRVNCTVFGAFKVPFTPGDVNADKNIMYNMDVSVALDNTSNSTIVDNTTYTLVDGNDRVYPLRVEYTRDLQPGRRMLGFVVPKEAVAKSLIIDPSVIDPEGDPFVIDFGNTVNESNGNITVIYYGPVGTKVDSNRKNLDFDVGVTNNGTKKLYVSNKNFTLVDQWGWLYQSREYNRYSKEGFPAKILVPNETMRTQVSFIYISPLSRPSKLVYDYTSKAPIIIDIDKYEGQGVNTTSVQSSDDSAAPDEPAPTSLAGQIKASKARLAKTKKNLNSTA
jgi:hypothetical protein